MLSIVTHNIPRECPYSLLCDRTISGLHQSEERRRTTAATGWVSFSCIAGKVVQVLVWICQNLSVCICLRTRAFLRSLSISRSEVGVVSFISILITTWMWLQTQSEGWPGTWKRGMKKRKMKVKILGVKIEQTCYGTSFKKKIRS